MLDEPGPFPGSLPPNRTCTFPCIRLSGDLCRVRGGVRVDPVVAGRADDEGLAPHFRHEGGPRGLARSRFPEFFEAGDLVDCHRGAGLAELAFPFAEPSDELLAGVGGRGGRGVADDRPPVAPQDDPAESCYQPLHPGGWSRRVKIPAGAGHGGLGPLPRHGWGSCCARACGVGQWARAARDAGAPWDTNPSNQPGAGVLT